MSMDRYILKNITKNDVNIGDLRYKIPAGQSRNLLSKTAHLSIEDITESRTSGSIFKRLGKSLVEVESVVVPSTPYMTTDSIQKVKFPQRIKSSITLEVGNISEEIQDMTIVEDEEFLKQLESESDLFDEGKAPIVAKSEGKGEKKIKT
jgi:hypothetical protein